MKTVSGLLTLGILLVAMPTGAEARSHHHHKDRVATASARRTPTDGFAARMSRLDALMGIKATSGARSASAAH